MNTRDAVGTGALRAANATEQCAAAVLMIRPAQFGSNPQTRASNAFQRDAAPGTGEPSLLAREECDAAVTTLAAAGVRVHAFDDLPEPRCPDALFPNNWVSFHADGTVVLYPMLAPNRRLERRFDLAWRLEEEGGYTVTRLVDLTHHEAAGHYLEGTGSLVLDHVHRVAYACRSPRTHAAPLEEFCADLGYTACVFDAVDAAGVPVYHTNVLLTIGRSLVIVADRQIADRDRERVLELLASSGRHLERLSAAQMACFAANVLELRGADGAGVLAMSQSAADAFGATTLERLARLAGRTAIVPIPTIEQLGGGSLRCMLAEVFLPARQAGRRTTGC